MTDRYACYVTLRHEMRLISASIVICHNHWFVKVKGVCSGGGVTGNAIKRSHPHLT